MFIGAGIPLALAVLLLVVIGQVAFQVGVVRGERIFTTHNFIRLYTDPSAYQSLLNTAGFALTTVLVSLFFGVPAAWLSERTDLPGRQYVFPLLTMTILLPNFFIAMGWQFLFEPRIGLVNKWMVETFGLDQPIFNINTLIGMGWVQGLALAPLAYVMLAGSFRSLDASLEETAQVHGLKFLARFRKVTIPLLRPAILATGLYVASIGIATFDVPAILGMPNGTLTFSTFVFIKAVPLFEPPQYGVIGAASAVMLLIALPISWWYLRVIKRANRYAVITGRGYRLQPFSLGRWWIAGWGFILLTLMLNLGLPLITLLWVSIIPFVEVPSVAALGRVSLDNFRAIPWPDLWAAAKNSSILLVTVPTLTAVVSIAISWIVVRSGSRLSGTFDVLAFIPHVVPHLIFAVGALLLALFWIPDFLPLYGTLWIILMVYVVTKISFATRIYNSALLQVHRELDEAGYVFGLSFVRVLRRILLPLLRPALVYTWLWMSLLTLRELTMAALLATRENVTVPVLIWTVWSEGRLNVSASISLLLVAAMIPFVAAYFLLTRRTMTSDVAA